MGTKFDLATIMAERSPATPGERTIETITEEILGLKQRAGEAILGIGQRLTEAKAMLPHGEWLPWLEDEVDFSERTAQTYMQLAREWTNPQTLADLGASKALKLLALPAGEREIFIAEAHVVKGEEKSVTEMSSRELAQALREREEALAEKRTAEQARAKMEEDMKAANLRLETAQREKDESEDREARLRRELEELKSRPIEVTGAAVPDVSALEAARAEGAEAARKEAEEKLRAKLEKAQSDRKDAADKLKELQETVKGKETAMFEERDALKARAEELERKLKLADSQDMSTFRVYFETVQENFNRMLGCLAKLESAGHGEDHDKLAAALRKLLHAMEEKVRGKAGEDDA